MPKAMTTKTTRSKKVAEPTRPAETAPVDEAEEVVPHVPEPKKFSNEDMIPCRSITVGELLVEGMKSRTLYRWANYGYVEEMQYQDLLYDIRSASNSFANKPCFIVEDQDFVDQNPKLAALYDSLYTAGDFDELIQKDAGTIKQIVPTLPKRVQESLKSYVATQIRNGTMDSINRIRALDEVFGTSMATMLFSN